MSADVIPIRPPQPDADISASHCVKTGPCPCEAPCRWAVQALDDIRRVEWPPHASGRFAPIFRELTPLWTANRAPRRSAVVLPFTPRGEDTP